MAYYEIPEDLQYRVQRHYDYMWLNERAFDEIKMLSDSSMSKVLRTNIALHLYKDLLQKVPYFQNISNKLLGKVCMALKNAIYLPSDVILHKGEYGHEMYIIRKGTVQILAKVEDFSNPIMLKDGSFFGEMALVMEVRRTVSVEAKTMCELCYLEKETFEFVIAE